MGSGMSSPTPNEIPGKRNNFLDKVQQEAKPEVVEGKDLPSSDVNKPKGTFLSNSTGGPTRAVEKKKPCSSHGG